MEGAKWMKRGEVDVVIATLDGFREHADKIGEAHSLIIQLGPPRWIPVEASVGSVMVARQIPSVPITLCMSGYDDDPRDLWEIPEARDYLLRVLAVVRKAQPRLFEEVLDRLDDTSRTWVALCTGRATYVPGRGAVFNSAIAFRRPA